MSLHQTPETPPREFVLPDENTHTLVACTVGISRSVKTVHILREAGQSGVIYLSGGLSLLKGFVTDSLDPYNRDQATIKHFREEAGHSLRTYYQLLGRSTIRNMFCFADDTDDIDDWSRREVTDLAQFLLPHINRRNVRANIHDNSATNVAHLILSTLERQGLKTV